MRGLGPRIVPTYPFYRLLLLSVLPDIVLRVGRLRDVVVGDGTMSHGSPNLRWRDLICTLVGHFCLVIALVSETIYGPWFARIIVS